MKLFRIMIALSAALLLAACSQATSSKKKDDTTTTTTTTTTGPWMLNFDSSTDTTNISSTVGYANAYASPLNVAIQAKETDTGYTPIPFDGTYTGTWSDTGLDLGTNSLKFELAFTPNTTDSTTDGHVLLSFKHLTGMDRSGRTGLTFTLKFLDAPSGSALGLMPHLRSVDYTATSPDDNANVVADEQWYFKTDPAYFVIKAPFADFTKPGYGEQSATTIATLPDSVVFNQLDFDIRMTTAGNLVPGTVYHAIIDNVGFY